MSHSDLPSDWPSRSLADPVVAADLLDLCVLDADRSSPGLSVLLCRPDGTLAQPVVLGAVPHESALREAIATTVLSSLTLPGVGGLVLGLLHPWGAVDDRDRRLHQHALEVAARAAVQLHGTFVVTRTGVTHLPVVQGLRAGQDVA